MSSAETQDVKQQAEAVGLEGSQLSQLLKVRSKVDEFFEPRTDVEKDRIEQGINDLVTFILRDDPSVVGKDAIRTIDKIIEVLDKKLTDQVNQIMHDPHFQAVEGTWRGLHYLVTKTVVSTQLKIKVMDMAKDELSDQMDNYEGAIFDQSPLFKTVYEQAIGTANAEPFACLVGDYHFDHSPTDVKTLKGVAKIAAAAHAPFIAGAGPKLFGMKDWTEINKPPRLDSLQDNNFYAPWRSFRDSEDARYIGLAMPRFVSRYPYGAETKKVKEFNFEEDTAAGDHSKYTWSNSAYAMAACITRAQFFDGFCTRIRGHNSGGMVAGLPAHTFQTDARGIQTKCPTEVSITERREKELADLGLMPLIHWQSTDYGVFVGAQSVQKPKQYEGVDGKMATANANLSARLPYIFACARFAHYLKRMVYESVGMYTTRQELEGWLQEWINGYVEKREDASQDARAKRPLREALVTVEEDPENPGYYGATFKLAPHIQLEGVSCMLSLVASLPKK
jgi:type VI secretion system protein ImpC